MAAFHVERDRIIMDILWFIVKAVGGTCLFTLILWYAQTKHPRAAGMMLTFPALNGIGLLTADSADVLRMASAMLPMIATNGILCAGYILIHRRLAACLSHLSFMLQIAVVLPVGLGLWFLVARGVMPHLPLHGLTQLLAFILAYGIAIWPLTAWLLWCPVHQQPWQQQGFWHMVRTNVDKMAGVFVLLSAVLLAAHRGADTWAGRLSTFPILPFYSLVMIPGHLPTPPQRIRQLNQLGSTVLLGPLVAMAFVAGFASYLALLQQYTRGTFYWGSGLLGLAICWGLCAGLIGLTARLSPPR